MDKRIIKTKEKLRAALHALMNEKPYSEISVLELCEICGIRRATFYRHFSDKNDFLCELVGEISREIAERAFQDCDPSEPIRQTTAYVREVIDYFGERGMLFENIVASSAFPFFYNTVLRSTETILRSNLEKSKALGLLPSIDIVALATFVNGGVANMTMKFLESKSEDKEGFIAILGETLTTIFGV